MSTKEQMAVAARYNVFSNGNVQVKERFLELLECDTGTTGEAICTKIKTSVADLGLDPTGLRAIMTDGAGNMCGRIRGAVTRLKETYPKLTHIHCYMCLIWRLSMLASCSLFKI